MKSRSKKAAFTAAIAALVSSHALSATPREPDETALKLYRSSITVQIADAMPWYVEEAGNPIRIDGISYATSQVAVALMGNVKRRAIDSMNRPPDTFLSKITDWRADIQYGTPFLVLTVSGSEENLCNEAASAWARTYIDVVCEQDSRALQDRLIELTRQIQNDKKTLHL